MVPAEAKIVLCDVPLAMPGVLESNSAPARLAEGRDDFHLVSGSASAGLP